MYIWTDIFFVAFSFFVPGLELIEITMTFFFLTKSFICLPIKALFKKITLILFQMKQRILSFSMKKNHNFLYRATTIHLSLLLKKKKIRY